MKDIDVDLQDPMIGSTMKSVFRKEQALWRLRNEKLDIYSRRHVEWGLFRRSPELSAIIIGHRLFADGHHPQFLYDLNRFWMWSLSKLENASLCGESELKDLSSAFDETGFSFELWKSHRPRQRYDFYMSLGPKEGFGVSLTPNLSRIETSTLSNEIQNALSSPESKDEGDSCQPQAVVKRQYAICHSSEALDAPSAADDFIFALSSMSKISSVLSPRKKRKSRIIWPLPKDTKIILKTGNEAAVQFLNYNRLHTEVVGLDTEVLLKTGAALHIQSPSFAALIDTYAAAMRVAQTGDTSLLFRTLSIGLDNVMIPVASVRNPSSEFRLVNIPGIAAKILALDALKMIFGSMCRIMQREAARLKLHSLDLSFAAIKKIKIEFLPESIEKIFPRNINTAQVFDMAWFIKINSARFVEFTQSMATRYFFDLKRCMLCRNEMVHRGRDKTNEYLGNTILMLFRLIIEFRLATTDILPILAPLDHRIKTQDDAFGVAVRLMARDFDALAKYQSAVGIKSDVSGLIHYGWGAWAAGTLPQMLTQCALRAAFKNYVTESINIDEEDLAPVNHSSSSLI